MQDKPTQLTPPRLLFLFCVTGLLLFLDRGCVSSNSVNGGPGYGIQGDFKLSLAADGFVAAALMTGLMLSTPMAALLSKRCNALRLIGAGLACWVLGTAATSLAPTFPLLLAARMLVGAGSGPFIAVAAPLIDDRAPQRQKSLWLAALFLCFPTGFACGYIYGGLVASAWGWRAAFMIEAAVMAPLATLCLLGPAVDIRRAALGAGGGSAGAAGSPWHLSKVLGVLAADLRALCAHPTCPLTIMAVALFNGALGGYAYYGPKAARDVFALEPEAGDLIFGAITVATGVLGTLAGGVALDCVGASVRSALGLCALGVAAGCGLVLTAFALARTLVPFSLLFGVGEFCMFIMAAPSPAVLLWSVPPELRPFALSMSEVMSHALGDIPSPPLLGWLQGNCGDWRVTMCVCTALLGASAALFEAARCSAHTALHYREVVPVEEEEGQGGGLGEEEEGGGLRQRLLEGQAAADHAGGG